jgi:hypothetical protein
MPKSHKVEVSGNPVEGADLRENVIASLDGRGTITEFLFDKNKNLALITVETEDELSFEDVTGFFADFSLYQVGPINQDPIPG